METTSLGDGETTPTGEDLFLGPGEDFPVSFMALLLGRLGGGVLGGSLVTWFRGDSGAGGLAVEGNGGGGVAGAVAAVLRLGGPPLELWKVSARALTLEPLGAGTGGPEGLPAAPPLDCLLKAGLDRGGRSGPGADITAGQKNSTVVRFHFVGVPRCKAATWLTAQLGQIMDKST